MNFWVGVKVSRAGPYLLQNRNLLQMIHRSGVIHAQSQPHDTRRHLRALGLIRHDLRFYERLVQRCRRYGAQCEKVFRGFIEPGEVPERGDPSRGIFVKEPLRDGLVSEEAEVCRVKILGVDGVDGGEVTVVEVLGGGRDGESQ